MNCKKIIKLLSVSFLSLILGAVVSCKTNNSELSKSERPLGSEELSESASEKSEIFSSEPESSEPASSEPVSSEPESSEPESTEPVSSEPSSSEPESSEPSSEPENPVDENVYRILLGEEEFVLEEMDSAPTGFEHQYAVVLETVTKGTEIKFYKGSIKIMPSCAQLGNNVVLTPETFVHVVHNDATNVKLSINVSTDGAEVYLEGYSTGSIVNFTCKVNDEEVELEDITYPGNGINANINIDLAIDDILVVYGDGAPLYIGNNAMSYNYEYKAPLPGTYKVEINEYNRVIITEPVLEIDELYLTYVDNELISPEKVTPDNPEDKAQFVIDLTKGQELIIKYVDGKTLATGAAVVDCTYTVYINKDGDVFLSMGNVQLNITATVDGEPLTLESRPAGDNFAVYRINVEAGQVVQFFSDGEPLQYHESSETTFSYEEGGVYTIFINKQLQVWDEKYVAVSYREVTVTGVEKSLFTNRNIFIWSWETGKEGMWVEEQARLNEDGSVTVFMPETYDNFLLIFTPDQSPSWNNVKSQTNDVSAPLGTETTTVTWKTKENAAGSTTPSSTYVLKGDFIGGNSWSADVNMNEVSSGIFEGTIEVTNRCEFKVKASSSNDWYPGGNNMIITGTGTYKITFKVSDHSISYTKVS